MTNSDFRRSPGRRGGIAVLGQRNPRQAVWVLLWFVPIAILSLILGLSLGLGQHLPGIALVSSLGLLFLYGWASVFSRDAGRSDVAFWLLLLSAAVLPVAHMILGLRANFFAEAVLFAVAPIAMVVAFRSLRGTNGERLFLTGLAIFLSWQILVTVLGRSQIIAAVYQFATNLKPFLLLALGFCLTWSPRTERAFWVVVRWAWLPIAIVVVMQLVAPGAYRSLLSSGAPIDVSPNPMLPFLTRMQGPFTHSSVLATLSVQFCLLAIVRVLTLVKNRRYIIVALAYLTLLVLSGQRQETFVFVMLIVAIWGSLRMQVGMVRLSLLLMAAAGIALALLWPFLGENFGVESQRWGGGTVGHEGVRSALYSAAMQIANDYFPLGSGLGTYGGPGAARLDQSLYLEMGLGRFWWFQRGLFLLDSIWACYIAELGWLGSAILLGLFVSLLASAAELYKLAQPGRPRLYALAALSTLAYALLVSPTAFVITDPVTGLLSFTLLGVAYRIVHPLPIGRSRRTRVLLEPRA